MKNFKILYFVLALATIISSCKNNTNKSEADEIDEVMLEETKEMIASIPAPNALVVMNLLNEAGAGYIFDITNKAEYVDNYLTVKQKALGLGVYSADLSYVTIYNQQEESAIYIKTFQQLIDELEIPVIDGNYIERMQEKISIKDSLISLVNEVFSKSNTHLNSSDRVDIALFILTGSWIETVYLIEKTIEFSANKKPLIKIVLHNKLTLDKIIELLEIRKNTDEFAELYDTLIEIQSLFNKLATSPDNEEKIEELKGAIKEARSNII